MASTARKLTPAQIAQSKITLDVSARAYSHETQTGLDKAGVIYMTTFNATQTFNSKGQPADKDNDK